jgi:two-component system, cell cycle response regulator
MPKANVLIVDDEPDILESLAKILIRDGYSVRMARDGQEALICASEFMPDLILLDIMMPQMDGKDVKMALDKDPKTAEIPVIFLSAKGRPEDKVEGLKLQPEDYVTKPFEVSELRARIETVLKRHRHYEVKAMTDGLTGLENFQSFKKQIEVLFNIAKRYERPFSVAVMDLDNLKTINDAHGHQAGDDAIKLVADTMKQIFREADILIRYGGDEFVVLFPECDWEQADVALSRFKTKLGEYSVPLAGGSGIPVSVSAGLASYERSIPNGSALFNRADAEMYRQKAQKKSSA